MEEIDPRYVYLLKNLRGIIYFSKNLDVKKEVKWINRKFRYRIIGIPQEFAKEVKLWKRAVILNLPFKIRSKNIAFKTALLASYFVVPILVLKEDSVKDFTKMIAGYVTCTTLDETEVKRNIRLANYAITDFYVEAVKLAEQRDVEKRRELVKRDLKRFWRVKGGKGIAVVYVDVLRAGISLRNLPLNCLSLVPCVVVDAKFIKRRKKKEEMTEGVKNF